MDEASFWTSSFHPPQDPLPTPAFFLLVSGPTHWVSGKWHLRFQPFSQPAEAATAPVLGSLCTVSARSRFLLSVQRPRSKAAVVIRGKVSVRAVGG